MSGSGKNIIKATKDADGHNEEAKFIYHRLVAYIMTIAPYLLQQYIEKEVLKGQSLTEYLEKEKHFLFRMFDKIPVCEFECTASTANYDKKGAHDKGRLTVVQFSILYDKGERRNKNCKSGKKLCSCLFTVNPKVDIQSLDITMISCIFDHSKLYVAADWIAKIKEIRNKIFHLADPYCNSSGNKTNLKDYLQQIDGSISGIAKLIGPDVEKKLQIDKEHVMSGEITSADILMAQKFIKEEHQRKNEELQRKLTLQMNELVQRLDNSTEKNQIQHLFNTSDSLRSTLNKVEISVSGNAGVKKLIDSYGGAFADAQMIPILCHMDVPTYWDKEDIANAVERLIKSHNEGHRNTRIRSITTGELNITVEIVRRVMRKVDEFQFEITNLVSEILKSSNVDVSSEATMKLNLLGPLNDQDLPTVEPSAHQEPVEPFMSQIHYHRLPSYWSISPEECSQTKKTYKLVKVSLDFERAVTKIVEETWHPQYTGIGRDPHRPDFNTIRVIDVQRIENPKLFVKYNNFREKLGHKSRVLKKSFQKLEDIPYEKKQHPILTTKNADNVLKVLDPEINEHYLFHCTQAEIIDDIAANGFDLSRDKRSWFGDAIYATESSRKGDRYADTKAASDEKKMILLRMALGEIFVTDKENKENIDHPPCKTCLDDHCSDATHNPDGHGFFDSIVVSGDSEFCEFLAFDPTQCYPEYVITYKTE